MGLKLRIGGKYLNHNKHEVQAIDFYANRLYSWHMLNYADGSWYFVNNEGKASVVVNQRHDQTVG